jgi:hypothetical protein
MTKLITILIIVATVFVGYRLYVYWEKVHSEGDIQEQRARRPLDPQQLQGIPFQLEDSLKAATRNGVTGLGKWLNAYGGQLQDPRLAWIEMDYCVMLTLSNPNEAKRIFNAIKERTSTNSPVFPRVKQLERTFD